jgi:drug/metabolite transporter (DMT)-like permease
MKLSAAFPMSAVSYVMIIVAGWTVFGEPASLLQVAGGAIILAGIWMIGRSEPETADAP